MRRTVRVTAEFFQHLDDQLSADRGPHGEPSATDFLVLELPPIVERFASGFDDLPEIIEGLPTARVLIATGILVSGIAAYGVLVSDATIDVIGIELDLS